MARKTITRMKAPPNVTVVYRATTTLTEISVWATKNGFELRITPLRKVEIGDGYAEGALLFKVSK